jgi:hypothetical protein
MLKDFLRSFFLVDLLKGLWVTLKYTPQPAFTFQYPSERRPVAPRFRGVLRLRSSPIRAPRSASSATSAPRRARTISSRSAGIASQA